MSSRPSAGGAEPSLGLALASMTVLQAVVSLGVFAPGVLAPSLGLASAQVSLLAALASLVAVGGAPLGGALVARLGSFAVGALCAGAVVVGMALTSLGTLPAFAVAALCIGLAFGAETPASSALLARLTAERLRPLVFSVRQTGNQIGAVVGSLSLPALAAWGGAPGALLLPAALGLATALALAGLGRRHPPPACHASGPIGVRAALRLVRRDPALLRLSLAGAAWCGLQMVMNTSFVVFAIEAWGTTHLAAGALLGLAQAGGLVGRLFWGALASRSGGAGAIVRGLGVAMGLLALLLAAVPGDAPLPARGALVLALGFAASGWNGVFLAEIARFSPPGLVPQVTGAVLSGAYAGLVVGPLLMSLAAATTGLPSGFAVLGVLALCATANLARRGTAPPARAVER